MNTSKNVVTAGRRGEVVVVSSDAYSAFCQICYSALAKTDSAEALSDLMGEGHMLILASAYDRSENEGASTLTRANNSAVMTEGVAVSFLELVRVANEHPDAVNRAALNGGAATSLTGVRY